MADQESSSTIPVITVISCLTLQQVQSKMSVIVLVPERHQYLQHIALLGERPIVKVILTNKQSSGQNGNK